MMPRRILPLIMGGVLSMVAASLAAQTGPQTWGQAVDDLQISLYLESASAAPSGLPAVGLAIKNIRSYARKVQIGGDCGPDRPGRKTTGVTLTIADLQGQSRTLEDMPGPPLAFFCAGVVDIFSVDVPPGSTVSVPLDLDCYYVAHTLGTYAWAGGGQYYLRAEIGRYGLKSNGLLVQFPPNAAPRRCFSDGLVIPCAENQRDLDTHPTAPRP